MTSSAARRSLSSTARRGLTLLLVMTALASGCSKDPETAKREFVTSGDAYALKKQYAEAVIQYRNAVQQDPQFGAARLKLGETYLQMGDRANALREIVRAADLLPNDVTAQIRAGSMLLISHMFEDAHARADKALALDPKNIEAQVLRANALAGLDKFDDAVAGMEAAIEADPERASSYAGLGAMQLIRGNKVEAEAAFKRAVEAAPSSAQSHLALANFYLAVQRRKDAETELLAALAINPKHVLANRAIAYFYMATGRPELAETPLKAVADLTSDADGRLALAAYYASRHRNEDAKRVLEQVIAAGKDGVIPARLQLANLAYSSGDAATATRYVDEVLARDPANTRALTARSELLADAGKLDDALAAARKASESDPQSAPARFAEGKVALLRRDDQAALTAFNEALRLNPRFLQARAELARLHLAAGRLAEAQQLAQAVVMDAPTSSESVLLLARVQIARGDVRRAEPPVRALARTAPNLPGLQATLGLIELRKGNRTAARAAFARALDLQPDDIEALRWLVRLDLQDKQAPSARARLEAALRKRSDDPRLLLLASDTMATIGDASAAEHFARQVLDGDPNNLDAYVALGRLYVATHRLDQAIVQFQQLADKQPQSVSVQTVIALLLEMQNKLPEAQAHYERIVQTAPHAAVASNNLAWIYAEHGGNLDKALNLAQAAKAELPGRPEVNDTLGWVYYKKGLATLAVPPLQMAASQAPNNPSYAYHLGMAQAAANNVDLAIASLKRVLVIDPAFGDAETVRSTLVRLEHLRDQGPRR